MPIDTLSPELQSNESLKDFGSADDLAKAYVEQHTRLSSGDMSVLPEDIRKDPSLANFKTVGDVAKSYIETKKLVGTIEKPPATSKDYKFTSIENLNPAIKVTDEVNQFFADSFHKAGLSQAKAESVYKTVLEFENNRVGKALATIEENRKKNEVALRNEWGADYDKNFNGITRVLAKAAGPEADSVINEVGIALKGNPVALKALGRIVNLLSEDSINSLGGGNRESAVEGEEKEFSDMSQALRTGDLKHPINDPKHPGHLAARQRWGQISGKFDVKR
jgi:hypothetical protein